ncbi:MAG: transport system substrate-binding protein [Chlorobi bacterium]|nr:transport system substrate-binding protein [Chlorobiota bacterium]
MLDPKDNANIQPRTATDAPTEESVAPPENSTINEEMVTGKDRSKRLFRAGVFTITGIIILIIAVFAIGGKESMFNKTFAVSSKFKMVQGLRSGALVTIKGIKVGTVSNVVLLMDTGSYVRVDMVVDEDMHPFVRTSTVASIAQQGLIGDKEIELLMGNNTAPMVRDGDTIKAAPPTDYTAVLDDAQVAVKNAGNITASLDTLFLRFRRGEGTLGKFLTDDEAYIGLTRVTRSAERLMNETTNQLAAVTTTLNRAAGNVDAITLESKQLVADIGNGKGTVGALLYDRSLYDSLESLAGTLNQAAGSAGFAAREFGINMRGLRSSWLVGGLFKGGEDEERNTATLTKELEIRSDELRRQKELLDERERQLMQREQKVSQKIN